MHVFIIAALTADGFIAKDTSHKSTRWTSPEDFAFFTQKTKQAGAVVMGSATYQTIGHPLSDRLTIVYTRHPEIQIPGVMTTSLPPSELVSLVETKGYSELAVCGGASIYTLFLESGLVDSLYLTTHTNVSFGTGIHLFTKPYHLPTPIKTTFLSTTTILNQYQLK